MSGNRDRSEIWNSVIIALRNDGATADEIAEESGTSIHAVRRVLSEMRRMGWIDWPFDDDGTLVPGETANELLR
jgi:DNA-binding IclR family transcriptional regulator